MTGSAHDSIARLQELAADAQASSARLADLAAPSERHEGRDSTSAVRVVLDGGLQLVELDLHESWRSRIGEDNLADAVREAFQNAGKARQAVLEQRIEAAAEAPPAGPGRVPPPRIDHVEFDIEQASAMIDHILDSLPRLDEQLAEFQRRAAAIADTAPTDVTVTGPREVVSVTVSPSGEITALDIDQRWLRRAPRELLTEELLASIQTAQHSGSMPELTEGLDALEDLRRMAADPQRLLHSFGFVVDQRM